MAILALRPKGDPAPVRTVNIDNTTFQTATAAVPGRGFI
jgi:hypothetical protein